MSPKIKKRATRTPRVQFQIRRIANRNPRNARVFRRFKRKLTRATAGLLAFGLLASGLFLSGGKLQSDVARSVTVASCEAEALAENFEDLTTRISNLSRGFPQLVANLDFCTDESCAAETKLYETEEEIWNLEYELTVLRKTMEAAQENFDEQLSQLENGALFCENEERCDTAETALRSAQICEKVFQNLEREWEIRDEVENEYTLVNSLGREYPTKTYITNLLEKFFRNVERENENRLAYGTCLGASDASVCQEYLVAADQAEENQDAIIAELSDLKEVLLQTIETLNKKVVAIEIGKKDAANFTENEGKGWCAEKLATAKENLSEKISAAANSKRAYETALSRLEAKKVNLAGAIDTELKALEEAEAEAKLKGESDAEAEAKRAKAETLFVIWTSIRNTF